MNKFFIFSFLMTISITNVASETGSKTSPVRAALAAITNHTPECNPEADISKGSTRVFGESKTATMRRSHDGSRLTIAGIVPVPVIKTLENCNITEGTVARYYSEETKFGNVTVVLNCKK